MVKPLSFKGDKKVKKRKRTRDDDGDAEGDGPASKDNKSGATQQHQQEDDESWVSAEAVTDIAGPVILVLPSNPPTCLTCDANGKVFASVVENMVEESASTAEPHDVRQVWIANRIAGTDTFSFKGHHVK
jgi:protein FRG1